MRHPSRTHLTVIAILLCFAASGSQAAPLLQGGRYALVIGNSHYGGGEEVSGVEDARRMKKALLQLGFDDVSIVTDGSRDQMLRSLDELGRRIRQAAVVVFFFSGHGFQSGAENYLMPVDGSVYPQSSLPLARVKIALNQAPNDAIKLVFLDACRNVKQLPPGAQGLKEEQAPASPRTLYAFAAGPGEVTPARAASEVSPYSDALLHYMKEPGIKITELLDKVSSDLTLRGVLPSYVINSVPPDFYLRDPVLVRAEVDNVDGDLLVVVNGEVALNSNEQSRTMLPLKAGHNELRLLMSKGKSFHNGQSWSITEGWSYSLKIGLSATGGISCQGPGQSGYCFSGHEESPFKDGPHHGGAFVVARATIVVDGDTAPPKVTLENSDTEVWNDEAPLWARDQELLYDKSVVSLNLSPDDIIGGLNLQPPWPVLLRPVVQEVLTSGKLLSYQVADPSQTFATVWGNRVLKAAVRTCMAQEAERISDLKAGITAVFARKPRPFDVFDQGLTACVRKAAGSGGPLKGEDIRIWTAILDRSQDTQGALYRDIPTVTRAPQKLEHLQTLRTIHGGSHE
jgi:hypothetical protein